MNAKQKKMLLVVGGVFFLVLVFLYLKGRGANAQQAALTLPSPGIGSAGSTDLSSLPGQIQDAINAINISHQGTAALAANQIVSQVSQFALLGAQSWVSCLPSGGGRPDAMCIKEKGGVFVPGGQNVSNVKTQHILDQVYVGPYAKCKRADGSYDLTCVGNLIAGNPPIQTVTVS